MPSGLWAKFEIGLTAPRIPLSEEIRQELFIRLAIERSLWRRLLPASLKILCDAGRRWAAAITAGGNRVIHTQITPPLWRDSLSASEGAAWFRIPPCYWLHCCNVL